MSKNTVVLCRRGKNREAKKRIIVRKRLMKNETAREKEQATMAFQSKLKSKASLAEAIQ